MAELPSLLDAWQKHCASATLEQLMSASKMQELWEAVAEDQSKEEETLQKLNAAFDRDYRMCCTAKVWSFGVGAKAQCQAQVNVNAIEEL